MALFGARNRDGWGVGITILTALANLLPVLPEEETYLALFHGARRVAADCDGEAPRRERAPLGEPAGPSGAQTLVAALDKRAPSRGGRAHPAHGDRDRRSRRLRSPMPCSRPRPSGHSPTPDTRSTSSTRRSSAST